MQRLSFAFARFVLMLLVAGCANTQLQEPNIMKKHNLPTAEPASASVTEAKSKIPPKSCPVTLGDQHIFQAPQPYSPTAPWNGFFWTGSEGLWTALPNDGIWAGLPHGAEGYSQKIFWWSTQFHLRDELQPALVVSGQRLDSDAPLIHFYGATNASAGDIGDAMLTGVDIPTGGCWEISGEYKKTELKFVIWVVE